MKKFISMVKPILTIIILVGIYATIEFIISFRYTLNLKTTLAPIVICFFITWFVCQFTYIKTEQNHKSRPSIFYWIRQHVYMNFFMTFIIIYSTGLLIFDDSLFSAHRDEMEGVIGTMFFLTFFYGFYWVFKYFKKDNKSALPHNKIYYLATYQCLLQSHLYAKIGLRFSLVALALLIFLYINSTQGSIEFIFIQIDSFILLGLFVSIYLFNIDLKAIRSGYPPSLFNNIESCSHMSYTKQLLCMLKKPFYFSQFLIYAAAVAFLKLVPFPFSFAR